MIISNIQLQKVLKAYGENTKVGKSANVEKNKPAAKKDEVVLSAEGREFSQIMKALKAVPEVRQDKVQELAGKINAGTYNVKAEDVAQKMLDRLLADRLGRM